MTRDEPNAWLTMGLRPFINDRGINLPRKVRHVMVSLEGLHLALRISLDTLEFNQVISIVLDVQFAHGGEVEASLNPRPR